MAAISALIRLLASTAVSGFWGRDDAASAATEKFEWENVNVESAINPVCRTSLFKCLYIVIIPFPQDAHIRLKGSERESSSFETKLEISERGYVSEEDQKKLVSGGRY